MHGDRDPYVSDVAKEARKKYVQRNSPMAHLEVSSSDHWTNESSKRLATMADYFTMGRKQNVNTFFICHSWYACPKVFRLNTQYAMIFRLLSVRELREMFKEQGTNIDRDQFMRAYKQATQMSYNFLLIDKKTNNPKLKFREGAGWSVSMDGA